MSNTYMLWCKRQRAKGNLVLGGTGTWKNLKGKKTREIRQIPPRVDRWLHNYRQRENLVKCSIPYPCSKLSPNVKLIATFSINISFATKCILKFIQADTYVKLRYKIKVQKMGEKRKL